MIRLAALALLALSIAGCGLTETVGSAATEATAKAQELKQAQATESRVKSDLDAAARASAEQRQAAEKDAQ
jgi:Spy/CpxP family protein refolding chaperone